MLKIGEIIDNRYEIIEILGSGGMADVYKAKCHKLNRIVAIKMLKSDYIDNSEFVSRFQIEAQAAACLAHSNIVGIYDVGQGKDCQYIVMEYVEGTTLKALIEEQGALPEEEVITIAAQIAQGIEAAHQQGIIHRDIKPQNILISSEGKAKVADFGIARITNIGNTIELMPAGSVHYIAPEQARGGYCDERSDIYSLGVTMYEMATGVVPFDKDSAVAIAVAHMSEPAIEPMERNEAISPALNSIILKCMSKKPDDRYPSAMALILDLKKALLTPGDMIDSVISTVGGGVASVTKSQTIIMDSDMVTKLKKENSRLGEGDKKMTDLDNKNDFEEEELNEEKATLIDKIILGIGIGIGVLILVAVIYVVASLSNLWSDSNESSSSKPNQTESVDKESDDASKETEESSTDDGLADDETRMPDVLSLTLQEAAALLEEYDLQYEVPTGYTVYSDEYPAGTICKQEYEKDEILKKYTKVKLTISLGDGKFEISEDFIDMPRQLFETKISGYGIEVEFIEEENDDYSSGRIFKTVPESGTLERGDKITVYVSKGPTFCKMPKVLNLTQEEAIATLEEWGLVIGNVKTDYHNDVPAGLVCSQSIAPNKKVQNGTSIDIVISLGRKTVTVPNVVGLTKEKAIEKLEEMELEIGEIIYESSTTVEEGEVIKQTPEGYEKAEVGTKVDIVVSKGKQAFEEEDIEFLIGKKESDVKELIAEAGLFYVKSEVEYSETVKKGCVIAVHYYDKTTKKHYEKDVLFEGDYVVLIVSDGKEESTTEVTTEESTTEESTTEESTTEAPTTQVPTTEAPTTQAPTTEAPTQAPTTEAPTQAPTQTPTEASTTEAPTTEASTTAAV